MTKQSLRKPSIFDRPLIERERERAGGKFAKKRKLNDGNTLNAALYPETLSTEETLERLSSQAQWFRDIELAAGKQATAYEKTIRDLRESTSTTHEEASEETAAGSIAIPPSSALHDLLADALPKPPSLSIDEWKKRESALLAHVHSIAERYRRELSGLSIYVNRSLKAFKELNMTAATLLCALSEREIPSIDMEAWIVEMISSDTHRCQCDICNTKDSPSKGKGSSSLVEVNNTDVLETLWNEREESNSSISQAREVLKKSGREEWTDWSKEFIADDRRAGERQKSEAEWIDKWNQWYENHVKEVEEAHLQEQQDIYAKRSFVEWTIQDRAMNLKIKTDEIQRLNTYLSNWERQQKQHTEPLQEYNQKTFPETAELSPDELAGLQSKTSADREAFWSNRQSRYLSSTPEEKRAWVATVLSRLEGSIQHLQIEVDREAQIVSSDQMVMEAEITDQEFLEVMEVDPGLRREWLLRKDDGIGALTLEGRWRHQASKIWQEFPRQSPIRWFLTKEYSDQQGTEFQENPRMALYENYDDGSSNFHFDSNQAWTEQFENPEHSDDSSEEKEMLREQFEQQMRDLARKRKEEKRIAKRARAGA